ncbi:hypothetical protein [Streptomyces sp. FH025]|uniref:hypothetical protein n=1 Tax=Streptomyces sp. FH025 TaxID=2815937 RepID=UPI001A9CE2A9|nr:hypothetical protein [Streptomyces sp. FH025]MBO1414662.1 hypothetical protein [Streptomyces sp. FH025]
MGFVIELRRTKPTTKSKRVAGPPAPLGALERYVEDGELHSAVRRIGSSRLPTLAGLDPYRDHKLQGEAARRLVKELETVSLDSLDPDERTVLEKLLEWGRRCQADPDLRIGFTGD